MKTTNSSSGTRYAAVSTVALSVAYAGLVGLPASTFPALICGAAALGLLGVACADYARKPRFRVRPSRTPDKQATAPVQPGSNDASAVWTYQTVSA
jgi:hypothetical protein